MTLMGKIRYDFGKAREPFSIEGPKWNLVVTGIFKFLNLFGGFSPITGNHFELEMPYCNTDTFQIFLNEFSKSYHEEFIILLLDNGAFHKSQKLIVTENIALLFISPYSPELNPSEKIWWKMKRFFSGKLHKSLDKVGVFIKKEVKRLTAINNQKLRRKRTEYEEAFAPAKISLQAAGNLTLMRLKIHAVLNTFSRINFELLLSKYWY